MPPRTRRRAIGRAPALAAVAVLALVPFVLLAPLILRGGYRATGASGLFPLDQLEYMARVREAGHLHHPLDHFPVFLVAGLVTRLGVTPQLTFVLFCFVGVPVLVFGFERYVRALLPPAHRTAGLMLALLYSSPLLAIAAWAHAARGADFRQLVYTAYYLFPGGVVWGYPHLAIALGLMPVCLLASVGALGGRHERLIAPTAGAVVSFLHPWQGLTLILVNALTALWSRGARTTRMLITLAATGAPIAYYQLLASSDPRVELSQRNTLLNAAPLWIVALALAPLVIAAVAGLPRTRERSLAERQLVVWPVVSLVCYWGVDANWQPFFLLGTTLPLAVLAVRGAVRLSRRGHVVVAAVAVAALVVPGLVYLTNLLRGREYGSTRSLYALHSGDARALDYVAAQSRPGQVLASGYLAVNAWTITGRRSWAASPFANPEYAIGGAEAAHLFDGTMPAAVARRFVTRTRAAYVVAGCEAKPGDLWRRLGPIVVASRRFGCATVYETRL